MTQAEFNRGVQAEINLLCRKGTLEALADERKMLEDEIRADDLEIRSRIDHRAEKIAAKLQVEKQMVSLAGGMD